VVIELNSGASLCNVESSVFLFGRFLKRHEPHICWDASRNFQTFPLMKTAYTPYTKTNEPETHEWGCNTVLNDTRLKTTMILPAFQNPQFDT
jgi:hypothetical protein